MISIRIGAIFNLVRRSHIIVIHLSFDLILDMEIYTLSSKVIYLFVIEYLLIKSRIRI